MRTATIYNFLLEANLMAGAAILLMIVVRKFLRKPLGNRLIYFLWLLIAIRLLCPLALSNPYINEFRPYHLDDLAIRPIAGQIKIRFTDVVNDLRRLMRSDRDSLLYQGARSIVDGMYYGTFSKLLMRVYLCGAGAVALFFGVSNVRFRRKMRANRIEQISGKLREQYLDVCKQRNVKPIPVWFTDPLPSACLVGVVRPYIALPLTAAPQEAVYVLTHEVCHYKVRDHWFSVLRLICCVVHWFNPLVWMAAFMSRTDGELACDSRVVQKLSPDDRLNYSNTLVLSASRRYAPGVGVLATGMTMTGKKLQHRVRSILNHGRAVKWLMAVFAVLASMALVLTFFTAEATDVSADRYIAGIQGYYSVSAGSDGTLSSPRTLSGMAAEDALTYAMKAIHTEFGADIEDTSKYSVCVDFFAAGTDLRFVSSCWYFAIINQETGENYDVFIQAVDGEVLDISGPGHG